MEMRFRYFSNIFITFFSYILELDIQFCRGKILRTCSTKKKLKQKFIEINEQIVGKHQFASIFTLEIGDKNKPNDDSFVFLVPK